MKIAYLAIISTLFLSSTIVSQVDINNKIMLAQSFEQAGDYDRAAILFEEIYSLQPQNYQVFESLNRVYIQSKKYESSVKLIESRLKQYPQDINLYGMLGTTHYQMGNESKAYETWERGLKIVWITGTPGPSSRVINLSASIDSPRVPWFGFITGSLAQS